jgi:predicted GNAT superfamily acetyltransferase
VLAEMPEVDGYRDNRRWHRLESIASARWLGSDLDLLPPDAYVAEVRAGAFVIAAYHALLVGVALALALAR